MDVSKRTISTVAKTYSNPSTQLTWMCMTQSRTPILAATTNHTSPHDEPTWLIYKNGNHKITAWNRSSPTSHNTSPSFPKHSDFAKLT
mmetsp:Transcript_8826/g.14852  ORF Transcript_8826/g.14852 Transcript_8826/m.14852 type:complete len:88 (-) Transcript_8826:38-301(-)